HVAIDAVLVVLLALHRRALRAGLVGVALEALAAVVAAPPRGRDRQVRVVAGDAAELVLVLAALVAAALVHLLEVVDGLRGGRALVADADGPEVLARPPPAR